MGITIHHRLAQEVKYIKPTLDYAELVAKSMQKEANILNIPFEIERLGDMKLMINIGGCETLMFNFKPLNEWKEKADKKGWNYQWGTLEEYKQFDNVGDHYEKWPDQKMVWSSEFCKTQFAGNIAEHKFVAELIRAVAGRCCFAVVSDEGDYYHTGDLEDAADSIQENGMMINSIGGMLQNAGWKDTQIVKGGETKIKSKKTK
jgi:hypothetical protein